MTNTNKRNTAIEKLIANWNEVIKEDTGDMQGVRECMIEGLKCQLFRDQQGWDMSAEDYNDELAEILGWDEIHEDEWLEIVESAARKFLIDNTGYSDDE